ncbi:alpha/beta hydrolase [Pseudoalteromonas sp. T1lg23B]|uniref:alpha/beta hydrolase n=1 Tax=Pseudoalteromonas sp. T1lg23B TaxID=2077097 RepID=UPI000CF72206|nr:alpha/beta fold hydrolase [Pseudoalteromonas sp. T1lg23B]
MIEQAQQQGTYRFAKNQGPVVWQIDLAAPFSEYLAQAKAIINSRNIRAQQHCPILTPVAKKLGYDSEHLKVADLIAPFELRQNNNDRAILMIHGLTDSPFTFHYLADRLYQQGYNVRTILLPGHGTAPSDLRHIDLAHWQALVNYAIARTAKDFQQFSVLGYSTGAALAVTEVSQHLPENMKALALISPASEPHNKQGWLAKWIAKIPFINWIDEDADFDFAKYESFPWQAAALANDAMVKLTTQTFPANLPLFSSLSEVDTTIDSQASLAMLTRFARDSQQPSTHSLLYYGNANAAKTQLPAGYNILSPQCNHLACDTIIDMSHIGVLQPAEHPYYGWQGTYRSCSGYLEQLPKYLKCKTHPSPLLGERTAQNTSHDVPLQRLTFNPAYDDFVAHLITFFDTHFSAHVQP